MLSPTSRVWTNFIGLNITVVTLNLSYFVVTESKMMTRLTYLY